MHVGLSGLISLNAIELPTLDTDALVELIRAGHPGFSGEGVGGFWGVSGFFLFRMTDFPNSGIAAKDMGGS